ncbi:hypothetical protein ACWAUP_004788 [Pseudomonas aeruginosa]
METRAVRSSRRPLLLSVLVLCIAALVWFVSNAHQADREEISLTEFCKGESEKPRLACMNIQPADATPMPPQG